jgi:hypothetical protein
MRPFKCSLIQQCRAVENVMKEFCEVGLNECTCIFNVYWFTLLSERLLYGGLVIERRDARYRDSCDAAPHTQKEIVINGFEPTLNLKER